MIDCLALVPNNKTRVCEPLGEQTSATNKEEGMTKEVMIYGIEAERLGAIVGKLVAAGISPQGLTNFLWLLKYRRQVLNFLIWVRRN